MKLVFFRVLLDYCFIKGKISWCYGSLAKGEVGNFQHLFKEISNY